MGAVGGAKVTYTPIRAFSRLTRWARSRIVATPTFSPPLTDNRLLDGPAVGAEADQDGCGPPTRPARAPGAPRDCRRSRAYCRPCRLPAGCTSGRLSAP